jgi:hypothetical protein
VTITKGEDRGPAGDRRGAIRPGRAGDRGTRGRNFVGRFLDGFDHDALTFAQLVRSRCWQIERTIVPRREHDGREEEDREEGSEEAREEEGRQEEVGRADLRSPA